MKIFEGQVISNVDFTESGEISVLCRDVNDYPIQVTYTSPYGSFFNRGQKSGFFAIPDPGEFVLIAQPENRTTYYFLGVIHKPLAPKGKNEIKDNIGAPHIPSEIYGMRRGRPQQLLIRDQKGNQLKLSSAYNRNFNIKAELRSHSGKKLLLSDSPKLNCIWLRTDKGDGIKLTSGEAGASAARSIEVETRGPVKLISKESGVDVLVVDGREINIRNESTGFNSIDEVPYGNINLESLWRDLNFTVYHDNGRIMIRTLGTNGLIQLNSNGSIIIKAPNNAIYFESDTLDFKARQIRIDADETIDIKAGDTAVISGRSAAVSVSQDAIIGGEYLHLNPLTGLPTAQNANTPPEVNNDYGN